MSSLTATRPLFIDSLVPVRSAQGSTTTPNWTLGSFKKGYVGLKCAFSWGERISDSKIAPIFSRQNQAIREHNSTFDLLGWVDQAKRLSGDISAAKASKDATARNAAVQKVVFTSIDFTSASIDAVQSLDSAHLISLVALSPALPRTLKAITVTGKLVVKANDFYHKYIKSYLHSKQTESKGLSFHVKVDKTDIAWKAIDVMRNILTFVSLILAAITFFFSINLSPYILLSITTFTFVASLAADLRASMHA
jgi:hypothetical protein